MSKLIDVVANMGVDIRNLLPLSMFNLLSEISKNHGLTGRKRAELAVDILGPETIIREKSYRDVLLNYIPENDANELLNKIKYSREHSTAWETLKAASYAHNNDNYKTLANYLEIELPQENDNDNVPLTDIVCVKPDYALFPHQITAIKKTNVFLKSADNKALLHMPTGSGKTRTAMNVICDLLRETNPTDDALVIWIAHSEELCDQACEEFQKAWKYIGNRPIDIYKRFGLYSGSLKGIKSGVLIAGISMLYNRAFSEESSFIDMAKNLKLIVFDEAHMAIAPTYKTVVDLLTAISRPALLGLSATPGRTTNSSQQNVELAEMFSKQKVILDIPGYSNPIDYLQSEGYISEVSFISLPYKPEDISLDADQLSSIKKGNDIPEDVLKMLALDEKRNILILNKTMEQADIGKSIIIFACSVEGAITLACILKYLGYKADVVTSMTPGAERKSIIERYKSGDLQIIVNFGVLTTGFDAPRTNVAIIARPTTSLVLYSQMVGRAIRGLKAGGNQLSSIFTVVDDIPGFRSVSDAFINWEKDWEENL